ncbi:MAG: cysteine desulfuration protein SufE [Rhizobiales bacterium]|nr:cysteine desulfuration protein SufE [Hyphomicrobiales bacterium]
MTDIQTIRDDFAFLDDWEDRYRYVIELGKAMPDLPEEFRTDTNKVRGCASQVWLVTRTEGNPDDPVMTFRGDSDAHIVRGLVAILLAAASGRKASDLADLDAGLLLDELGLGEHLTAQRANGLRSMVERIKAEAARATA